MGKFIIKFSLFSLIAIIILAIYLNLVGINTDKFDNIIKNKANEINKNVKLEFKKTKIHFNFSELNLVVKLQNPKIEIKNDQIDLSKLDLFLPLKSFFSSDFLLQKTEIAFVKNDIKDLTKVTNIFLPKLINNKLKKIFAMGNLEGEFIIPFKPDGSIGNDYGFTGEVSNALINLTKELSIKNLTTKIKHTMGPEGDIFDLRVKEGLIYNIQLAGSIINLKRKKDMTEVQSSLKTNGKINSLQFNKLLTLFDLNISNIEEINGDVDLITKISFNLEKKIKLKNLKYESAGKIDNLEIQTSEIKTIKKYLPDYEAKIILKDTDFKFSNSRSGFMIELNGMFRTKDQFDSFNLNQTLNKNSKKFDVKGSFNLINSKIKIDKLNYNKDAGKKSELNFDINLVLDKFYHIRNLNFIEDKTKIYLSDIKFNKKFEIIDFKEAKIKTFSNEIKNNDFFAKKSEKIIISGDIYDSQPLLKSLYRKDDKKTFSKKFNSEVKVNFNKTLTGTNDDISDFAMIASIKNGSYEKLSLKGNYSAKEIIEMSIYQVDKDKKTLQVISDRARPFIKNFDFIKGFENGKLEYESIISKEVANSNLIITDFKVSKVPALAKLLTLASLKGIADTLSGEGISFDSFEMKSNTKGNLLNIEDALAIGPAVSILLDGYVDKGKIVSLRGTLVPATKLNSIIASIPLVGEVLVGKKTGEGVVGVSFKMKGPPKDIKTTVNPIKTLTPRFIVRAVEKMKSKKKEETK
tara:strand:- start:738 stop:2975 length:2238 start_codon:yes stop_codon:yes gene_type:complete